MQFQIDSWLGENSSFSSDNVCYASQDTCDNFLSENKRISSRMQRLSTSKLGCCQHKKHLRLENLRTLILADNRLDKIPLYHLADGDSSRLIKLFGFLSLKRLAFSSPSGKKALLIITSLFFSTLSSNDENEAPGLTTQKQKIMFPTLSMMDLSNNRLELDCTYCKVFPSF